MKYSIKLTIITFILMLFITSCSGPDLNGKTYSKSNLSGNFKFGNEDVEYIWFRPGSNTQNTEYGSYSVSGNEVSIKINGREEWNYEYDSKKLFILDENGDRFGSYLIENKL